MLLQYGKVFKLIFLLSKYLNIYINKFIITERKILNEINIFLFMKIFHIILISINILLSWLQAKKYKSLFKDYVRSIYFFLKKNIKNK